MKIFSQTLFRNAEPNQPAFSQKVKEDALDDLGIVLFTIKFQYEFIADTLIQVAEEHSVDRKCVFRILRKNEEKLVRELFDKQRDIDISNIVAEKMKSKREMQLEDVLSRVSVYLNCTETLELGLSCKKVWFKVGTLLPDKILLLEQSISKKQRLMYYSHHILPEFSKEDLKVLELDEDDEIILLDVKRTYPFHKKFDKDKLIQILKNIKTRFAGSVCYYQGLNYLAGYLLHISEDPVFAYRLTMSLLKQHISLFVGEDLRNMKIVFHIYSRLIQLFIPTLYEKLKAERVSVDVFSASWFLTIFTTVSQNDPDSHNLLHIMDLFVAGGWTEFFKVAVLILRCRKDDLERMHYEDIMMTFFNISKSSLFRGAESRLSLKSESSINSMSESTMEPSGGSISSFSVKSARERAGSSAPTEISGVDSLKAATEPQDSDGWPEISIKSDVLKVKISTPLITTLQKEYNTLAKQIENFWEFYEGSGSNSKRKPLLMAPSKTTQK